MSNFLKVLFRNFLQGPSTDPYPVGETFTPDRLRGKVVIDPEKCVGCGVCKNSCVAGAIDISPKKDKSGYTITVWRNSCCLCASCRHYCPTGAITLTNDWHHAHEQSEKYDLVEKHTIDFEPCLECGELIRPLPDHLAKKVYASNTDIEQDRVRHLCPKCRRIEEARRIAAKTAALEAEKVTAVGEAGEKKAAQVKAVEKATA